MTENKLSARIIFNALGLIFSVIPPALAIITYFPVWVKAGGEYLLSGVTALLLVIALVPLFRVIKRALASPSGYTVWLIIFVLFLLASKIADEMLVISFVGLIGNIIGAIFFRLAKRCKNEDR